MTNQNCTLCHKKLYRNISLKCNLCPSKFHLKCCTPTDRTYSKSNLPWYCIECNPFPFAQLSNVELNDQFNNSRAENNKTKCSGCKKKIIRNTRFKQCKQCRSPYHIGCSTKDIGEWTCSYCILSELPLHKLTNEDFDLNLIGLNKHDSEYVKNTPSFSIKTLLDSLPGENFSKDDFISNTIDSRYYSPTNFLTEKFSKSQFSMIHLNIASLQLHIDELRTLLNIIQNPFDIIAITETRLHDQNPLIDLSIDGYDFLHKETHTQNGGVAIYIKSCYNYVVLNEYTTSLDNICETLFIEIKSDKQKNLVIGCVYRHHTPINLFCTEYLNSTLQKIAKSKKTFALLGDFNINLLDYEKHSGVGDFYDLISSCGFRPLILQPTRVTKTSATLIDNIFINDLSCQSKGGNLVTSISDHYMQFSQIDIFDKQYEQTKNKKYVRNWRIFNKREFQSELSSIDWDTTIQPQMNTNTSCSIFYNKITKLLDEMAPLKKLSKKEISLKNKPWISQGILKSMKERDKIYKKFTIETDESRKDEIYKKYKYFRNKITTLTRKNKKKYYSEYFSEHNANIKKTWEGIRQLININKKKTISIRTINQDGTSLTDNKDMANAFNNFYANIGNSIEQKIPKTQKTHMAYLSNPTNNIFEHTPCTEIEIKTIINNFGVNKSSGPNSIPTNLLKEFCPLFSYPLKILINKSLNEGSFPSLFKIGLVCPIYKKAEKTKCVNYRPISLLSNLSKIFERVMYNRIEFYLENNKIIYDLEFGFRKKFSTEHG